MWTSNATPKRSRRWMRRCGSGDAVCIFPEGVSHSTGRLEPLRTGAARMALSAAAQGIDVQLVPVGINPEDKTDFRSRLTIVYGHPFRSCGDSPAGGGDDEIAERMRHLIVEADPDADAELVMRIDRLYAAERETPIDPAAALERRRTIASGTRIDCARRIQSRTRSALLQLRRYDQRLAVSGFAIARSTGTRRGRMRCSLRPARCRWPLLLVPLVMAAVVAFAVPYYLTALIGRRQRDTDVTATAKVVAGSVFYPLWILAMAIATACVLEHPGAFSRPSPCRCSRSPGSSRWNGRPRRFVR